MLAHGSSNSLRNTAIPKYPATSGNVPSQDRLDSHADRQTGQPSRRTLVHDMIDGSGKLYSEWTRHRGDYHDRTFTPLVNDRFSGGA
jgi:hypothetical protein